MVESKNKITWEIRRFASMDPERGINGVLSAIEQSITSKKLRSSSTKQSVMGVCWVFLGNMFVMYSRIDMPKLPSRDPNSSRLGNGPTLVRYLPKCLLISCLPGLALNR